MVGRQALALGQPRCKLKAMREVYTSQDPTQVGYYKSVLDEAGIRSFIRNESGNNPAIAGAMFLPTLCIIDDADYDEAIRIMKSQQIKEDVRVDEWKCPSCSEINPPNFELCWNCNSVRPEA
jgi:hypothetical protein